MTIDYGPAVIRTRRGELQTWGGAAEIEIGDRVDPTRSTKTRGAERADAVKKTYGAMHPFWRAAERFRDDCAIAGGARDGNGPSGIHAGFSPSNYGPGDAQLDAATRARLAWQALGITSAGIVTACILGCQTIGAFHTERGVGPSVAKRWLHDALTRLDAHYRVVDGG